MTATPSKSSIKMCVEGLHMTKKDLITEVIEELNAKGIIADEHVNLAIGIAMGVFVDFTVMSNPYVLREE